VDDRYRRNVPDPSATIPDFGPRPDIKVKAEEARVARTPDGDVAVGGKGRISRAAAPEQKSFNPLVLAIVGLLVALVAGGLGFFVVVFAGMLFWLILGA
jgi:hypothetical protein